MPPVPRLAARRDHLVVCGDDALAVRVIEELTTTYGEDVTVLLRSREAGEGPRIARMPKVRVIERTELDASAFTAAGVQSARSLALLRQDDLGNFHAALRAQEINPELRLVVAIFNTSLGERIRTFFRDCAVLSGSSMSAPSFVAAALGEPAPSHIRVAGRTQYVARRTDINPKSTLCALAMTEDPLSPRLLPPDTVGADLVLAIADGAPRNPLTRQRRHPVRGAVQWARRLFSQKLNLVFAGLFVVLVTGFVLLAGVRIVHGPWNAAYLTGLDAAGAAVSDQTLPTEEKWAQILLTFDGLVLLPVFTAVVVGARLTGSAQRHERPLNDHVIVVGLGNVGTRIVGQLHDLGVDVACVDKSETAAGMGMARQLDLRVVIGETDREDTLRAAGISTCQALVSVTNSDIVNLETALLARSLAEDIRIVLRLGDDDLAGRVQRNVGNTISRSVPYVAAPSFAAAMLEHQVLRTIPVGRHVLLIADLTVGAGSGLDGSPVEEVHQNGLVRVLAVQRSGDAAVDWSPAGDLRLAAQDRLFVIATRAGLSRVLAGSQAPRG